MKITINLFIILFLAIHSIVFADGSDKNITAEDCKACDLDCSQRFQPGSSYILTDSSVTKKLMIFFDSENAGAQNSDIIVFLHDGSTCRAVLNGGGSGASFEEKPKAIYPDIITYWHMSASEGTRTRYVWNGKEYEDIVRKANIEKSKSLSDEAIHLFRQKKIEAAIAIWQKIEKLHVADAEILNNLGFAYYELATKTKNYDFYNKAENYLRRTLDREPERWSALLNMGDLEYDMNDFIWAIKRYDKLLKVKPDYKYANKIRKRIEELKRKPEEVGIEIIASRHPSGKKDIIYIRIDNKDVMRQGYYDSGQLRFRQNIVDGYENGEYKSWFENGQLSVIGQQKMGEGIGRYIYYKPDGRISQVRIFKEDGTSVDVTKEYVK